MQSISFREGSSEMLGPWIPDYERVLFTDPHRLHELFNLCVNARPNSAHLFTFMNLPSP
jgi:hypothetical protein